MARPQYYTTQLQAGAGLVEETRLLLSLYEPGMDPQALLARALDSGLFPRVTARRLRNMVIECFAPRYMREPDAAWMLKPLAEHVSRAELLQLLLLYTARANLVVSDFVTQLYWPRYRRSNLLHWRRLAVRAVQGGCHNGEGALREGAAIDASPGAQKPRWVHWRARRLPADIRCLWAGPGCVHPRPHRPRQRGRRRLCCRSGPTVFSLGQGRAVSEVIGRYLALKCGAPS